MRAAAAKIAGQCLPNLRFAWVLGPGEESGGFHDHAVDAISALQRLLVDKGLLQRMRSLGCTEPFQGNDRAVAYRRERSNARPHRVPIDVDRAGAALSEPATKTRAVEAQIVAQCIEQRHVRIVDHDADSLPVNVEIYGCRHLRLNQSASTKNKQFRVRMQDGEEG